MPNRNYNRGAAFERAVAGAFSDMGYAAFRSAGSHSPADVFALAPGVAVCVQCKTDGRLDPDEWNCFLAFCEKAGAVPIMARRKDGRRGAEYFRLTGPKDGRGGPQPMEPWRIPLPTVGDAL